LWRRWRSKNGGGEWRAVIYDAIAVENLAFYVANVVTSSSVSNSYQLSVNSLQFNTMANLAAISAIAKRVIMPDLPEVRC